MKHSYEILSFDVIFKRLSYKLFTYFSGSRNVLLIVAKTTVRGTARNNPAVPNTDVVAHIENIIQNGDIPSFSPINLGVR